MNLNLYGAPTISPLDFILIYKSQAKPRTVKAPHFQMSMIIPPSAHPPPLRSWSREKVLASSKVLLFNRNDKRSRRRALLAFNQVRLFIFRVSRMCHEKTDAGWSQSNSARASALSHLRLLGGFRGRPLAVGERQLPFLTCLFRE